MKNIYLFGNMRGEIATILTIISAVMMIAGMITGSVINNQGTRTTSRATGCDDPKWECTVDGVTHCADQNSRDIFTGTWCNPDLRWKWEDAGNRDKCGGSPAKLKPADGNCADTTPTSVPSGNCPSGQWTCKVGTYTRCSDDTAKSEFTANWCDPEQRWQFETAKLLGGNGSECNGKVSQTLPNCSTATPTSNPSGTCPTFQWNCTFDGKTYCTDDTAKTLFMDTWCDGKNRWLWESAGNSDKCGGNADIPINSPDCKRNPITTTSPTPVLSPSPIPSPTPNATKAPNPGGFHLTSDIYAEKTSDGIKFNVHVLFNFDGCDGDVSLFRDGTKVAGYNGWKGPGAYDYNQEWAGSFEVKKGDSVSPGYEGTVDRCPKSSVTLRDNISCEMSVDGNGVPGVAGTGCTFKNKSEFGNQTPPTPAPTTAPRPIAGDCVNIKSVSYTPGGALDGNQAFTCQATIDQADSNNIACGWSKNGGWPQNGGKWENVGCKGTDCSFGIQTEKDIDKNATYELVAFDSRWNCGPGTGKRTSLQVKGVTPIPTQKDCDNTCCGKPDGYVWNSEVEEQCNGQNWALIQGICKNGKIKYQPGCTTCDKCDSSKDTKPRTVQASSLQKNACTPGGGCNAPITPVAPITSGPGTGTPTPSITPGGPSLTPSPTITPGGPTLTPRPGAATPTPGVVNMRELQVIYHITNVCKVWAICDDNYKNGNWTGGDSDIMGEVWYKISDTNSSPSYITLAREYNFTFNPLDPYIDVVKNKVQFQIGKTYKGSASFKYKHKDTLCIAYKDETKTITGADNEFRFDYSLNPSVDCTNPPDKPSILKGSSNQDFITVIDRYAKGEIGAQEVSTFISQLNRSPFQPVYCTCPGGNCSQCTGPVYPAQGEESL